MRLVALLVLVFGVALAGGAIFFASEAFRAREAALVTRNTGPETVGVIVAGEPLAFGDPVTEDMIRIVQWPRGAAPDGSFTSIEEVVGSDPDEPRYALRAIDRGEPILSSKLSDFGEQPRVVSALPPGMRAVSIRIDAVSGVSGFVAPGDRVDIVLTRAVEREMTSQIVLQDIMIIAVDQKSDTESISPRLGRTATVAVTQDDALILATAQSAGKLSLILRGAGEVGSAEVSPVRVSDLLEQEEEALPTPTPVPDAGVTVRVRRGISESTETFGAEGGGETVGDGTAGEVQQ